jgi:heptosyltransferase III
MIRKAVRYARDRTLPALNLRPFRPIEAPRNTILAVKPDHFGDLLLLGPAVRFLQKHAPDHEIVLMTGPWNESVARHLLPEVTCLVWPFPGFVRDAAPRSIQPYRDIWNSAAVVREVSPVASILFRDDHWWGAMMTREAGVPIRVGYDEPQVRPFITHPMQIPAMNYASQNVEIARRTLPLLGYEHTPEENSANLFWPVNSESHQAIEELLGKTFLYQDFVCIHPGSGASVKLWPERRWAQVIDDIVRKTGLAVLLTGSAQERPMCEAIASMCRSEPQNLAGSTSLMMLGELFRSAKLVAGVDSGPLHLAVATGTRTVHLYGPSDRVRFGPAGTPSDHRVISAGMNCPSCGDLSPGRSAGCGCMTAITTAEVSQNVVEVLYAG